jgi:hypothetical protein
VRQAEKVTQSVLKTKRMMSTETWTGILDSTNAETNKGDEGTAENAGKSVRGDSVYMSNADKAEAKERVRLFPPLLVGSLILPFGIAIVIVVGSIATCAIIRGDEGG